MTKIQFKTSINCDACVAKVTPVLDADPAIGHWEVDTKNPDKILTVEGEHIQEEEITAALKKIGYRVEKV